MEKAFNSNALTQQKAATQNARVIVGATVLGLGGIRTHLILLLKLLRRHGVEVVVFATGADWDEETIASMERIGVIFKLPPAAIRKSRRLSSIYCVFAWPFMVPRQANSLYCIAPGYSQLLLHWLKPAGVLSINHEIVEAPLPRDRAGRCASVLDASIGNSRKVSQMMQARWPGKPVKDIPFLTSDAATPLPTRPPRQPDQPLRVAYLGRLVEHKRPDQLVRRWPELILNEVLRAARLDVYGYDPDGRMLRELQEFVRQSKLDEQVRIYGGYDPKELPGILAGADVVVLPSLLEGLPLVLVEAMLAGVPIVATAAGGTEELGNNNPDVVITTTDWADFERGLLLMAGRIRSGAIAAARLHDWAEKRYGYETVSAKWLACLRQPEEFFNQS